MTIEPIVRPFKSMIEHLFIVDLSAFGKEISGVFSQEQKKPSAPFPDPHFHNHEENTSTTVSTTPPPPNPRPTMPCEEKRCFGRRGPWTTAIIAKVDRRGGIPGCQAPRRRYSGSIVRVGNSVRAETGERGEVWVRSVDVSEIMHPDDLRRFHSQFSGKNSSDPHPRGHRDSRGS